MLDQAAFWRDFSGAAQSIAKSLADGSMRVAFEEVDLLLAKHAIPFCFDLTRSPANEPTLILTPEGNATLAEQIDHLLSSRPEIPGWLFYGRRQRRPLSDAFAFVQAIYQRNIRDLTANADDLGDNFLIYLFSPGFATLSVDQQLGAAATFLDHAVGEPTVMRLVANVAVSAVGKGQLPAADLVKLLTEQETRP